LAICQSPICSNAILPHLITIELLSGLGIQQVGHDGKAESSTTSSELLLHEIEDQNAIHGRHLSYYMFPYCRRQIKNASEAKNKGASHFNLTLSYWFHFFV
jgi:hypothetical protein